MIQTDQPKTDPEEDIFGYASFAKTLAHSILRSNPANGFVVGIYGEWGLGKSTLLNFIEHYARADVDEETPLVVVRFNPWWFSGREDLVRRFFAELEKAALRANIKGRKNKKILLESIRQLGRASAKALAFVPAVPPGVAQVVDHATSLIPLEKLPDIVELKQRIDGALNKAGLRVLVLIDEIDRLLPDEMIDVFRLVRSVGDLTGVNYVLAFDRDIVVSALTNHLRLDGAKYLEKIVQAPFDLPRPEPQVLQRWFGNVLEGLVGESPGVRFDQEHWNEIFLDGIVHFIKTPRDVIRLTNAIATTYPAVRNEVDFADFTAVETLRIFEPLAYDTIRKNRSEFVVVRPQTESFQREALEFHEGWLKGVGNARIVRRVIVRLFPQQGSVLEKGRGDYVDFPRMRRSARVCTSEHFRSYFRYALGDGLSREQFDDLLTQPNEVLRSRLSVWATEMQESGGTRLRSFLQMLGDELDSNQELPAQGLLEGLCHCGEMAFTQERPSVFEISDGLLVAHTIEGLLLRIPLEARTEELIRCLGSAGLNTVVAVIYTLGAAHGRYGEALDPVEQRAVPEEELERLGEFARRRFDTAEANGQLWEATNFPGLLFTWAQVIGSQSVREAVAEWILGAANLARLIRGLPNRSGRGPALDLKNLDVLVDLEDVAGLAEGFISASATNSDDVHVLKTFLNQFEGQRAEYAQAKAELRILQAVVSNSRQLGHFPPQNWLDNVFESERSAVLSLKESGLLSDVYNDSCMVTLRGLRRLKDSPEARQEIEAVRTLFEVLRKHYLVHQQDPVSLDELSRSSHANGLSLHQLERAARTLLVHFSNGAILKADGASSETQGPLRLIPGSEILGANVDP